MHSIVSTTILSDVLSDTIECMFCKHSIVMNNKKGTHRNGVPFFIMRFQEAAGTGKKS